MAHNTMFTSEESRWNAVTLRDRAAEGAFFYAVKTTGVFCRPGCSSRLPKRENVEFFEYCKQAEQAGYRPCKRCKPGATSPRERLIALVVQACRHIEASETSLTLDQLAEEANLSPWHFQRVFKKAVGVTPKQYAATHQAQRFRNSLKTEQSVTAAIYDAGFGSSSRAYDSVGVRLAMTPSAYRKGGADLTIQYAIAPCFLGWVIVAVSDRGICAIEFGDNPETLPLQVQQRFSKARLEAGGPELSAIIDLVISLIETPEIEVELPLDIQGTAFQQRVWSALRSIPSGHTVSYAQIARQIGSPNAVRAVAQACGANKLGFVVPCHRVVRSDGALSGYRWGVERKRMLLRREGGSSEELDARDKGLHES